MVWLTPAQASLFDGHAGSTTQRPRPSFRTCGPAAPRPRPPRRGLCNDCGKGPRVRLVHRVGLVARPALRSVDLASRSHCRHFERGWPNCATIRERSAELAAAAAAPTATVELIRNQEAPTDDAGRLLPLPDEAN